MGRTARRSAGPPSPPIRTVTVGPWIPQGQPQPLRAWGLRALTAGAGFHRASETYNFPARRVAPVGNSTVT
jgi:hypothetical protein